MPALQELLHKFEEGAGSRVIKAILLVLALVTLLLVYNFRSYRNLSTLEAMDAAQLGRNVAEGHGFSTLFIRPLSIHLVQKTSGKTAAPIFRGTAQLAGDHPDLANPPVYPLMLAGLLKVVRPSYDVAPPQSFWSRDGSFWWYGPDFIISLFNQCLFLVAIGLTFLLARRLFDLTVAWITALLMLGTDLFWRFAVSGLSTMVLIVIFLGLCWCLMLVEQAGRDPVRPPTNATALAAVAGLILGIGGLTRYSFAWLLVPLAVFLLLFSGPNRVLNVIAAVAACLIVMSPWVVRNVRLSGLPFGTATLAVLQGTAPQFEGNKLDRALAPDLSQANFYSFLNKFKANVRNLLIEELPRFAGSWVSAFFLVGLMVAFLNPAPGRLRYFIVGCLLMFCLVQALGKTHLSTDSPEINSENLLVLLSPLVLMFGVSLFCILLERMVLPFRELRLIVIGLFIAINGVPLIMTFMPPRSHPLTYPPYHPPAIQMVCKWMKPDETMMSDIPWAVAWYGRRQCIWLTLDAGKSFYDINDYQKQVQALYLTPLTLDSRFLSDWVRADQKSWGSFILATVVGNQVPEGFPLRKAPDFFRASKFEQLFLSDLQRW